MGGRQEQILVSLSFPTRFFRKLNIHQQIRTNTGAAKHKRPWRQEAVFLKWAYEGGQEYLHGCVIYDHFKKEARLINDVATHFHKNGTNPTKIEQTIRSLFSKELIELRPQANMARGGHQALTGKYSIWLSPTGLEIGEVLAEINNSIWLVRWWHNLKYRSSSFLITTTLFVSVMCASFMCTLAVRSWLS